MEPNAKLAQLLAHHAAPQLDAQPASKDSSTKMLVLPNAILDTTETPPPNNARPVTPHAHLAKADSFHNVTDATTVSS
jgi:hypothetical protein